MADKPVRIQNVDSSVIIGGDSTGNVTNINQSIKSKMDSLDLSQLIDELSQLREAMAKEAKTDDESVAVAAVVQAKKAAQAKNREEMAKQLKAAGQWALDVATKIGIPLAIAAIKLSLGIP